MRIAACTAHHRSASLRENASLRERVEVGEEHDTVGNERDWNTRVERAHRLEHCDRHGPLGRAQAGNVPSFQGLISSRDLIRWERPLLFTVAEGRDCSAGVQKIFFFTFNI